MKHLLLALPLCALIACGGSKTEGTNAAVPAPASTEFAKLKLGDKTVLSNGAGLGMTKEEVKKLHGSDPVDNEDDTYMSYVYSLGPEEYDHEFLLDYAFDSESGKAWQVSWDISVPDVETGKTLYNDIVGNFEAKYGKGKDVGDKNWQEMEWKGVQINGQKTDITVQRMVNSEAGYLLMYFEESYE